MREIITEALIATFNLLIDCTCAIAKAAILLWLPVMFIYFLFKNKGISKSN
ncbi:MAG: hypothetical protein J1E38_04095 [Paramuribaculum sp.]|nr:hypothetical protein [Paramuribaculum sp.]